MLRDLSGTVAWVTGAGTGIGQGGAVALAGEGVRVVLSGRRRPELERTAKAIEDGGGVAVIEPLDVTDQAGRGGGGPAHQ